MRVSTVSFNLGYCAAVVAGGTDAGMRTMALWEYEKEDALDQSKIERAITACDAGNSEQCRELVQSAAKLAFERFFRIRFGWFNGRGEKCVVYVNMGRENQFVRDVFRRQLAEAGVAELSVGIWPLEGERDAHYTWAVMIGSSDGERWRNLAAKVWSDEYAGGL